MLSEAASEPIPESELSRWFDRLDRLLNGTRQYWQLRPYHLWDYPWRGAQPALADCLDRLDDAAVERLDGDPGALAALLAEHIPAANGIMALTELVPTGAGADKYPARLSQHIPGRKWHQITAFAAALPDYGLPVLEWCAGKGHLGRALAWRMGTRVESIEHDAVLCESGQKLAGRLALPVLFHCLDVMADSVVERLQSHQHAVALHACGALHQRLLHLACGRGTRAVSVAPCCYHLITTPLYRPLSRHAAGSNLRLTRFDLQLPQQELVTGSARTRRLRDTEVTWRLGFDCLQRALTGNDRYLPVPNVRASLLGQDFAAFCHWAAARKGMALPAAIDFARFEAAGQARRPLVRRLGLVRHLFRRPLELWLLLDRALLLAGQGYAVSLTRFCEPAVTPRNLLLQGWRGGG